jgi:uncharacterized protein YggU (UPF0235/DUF167 family)
VKVVTRRFTIRVKPGAKGDHLGGTWGENGPLNVWVSKPAVDGAANRAAVDIVASALKIPRRQLEIVAGHTARVKTIEVSNPPDDLDQRLDRWRSKR